MKPETGVWAVLPVKRFANAKSRLAPMLGECERRELARRMFEDVLEALLRCQEILAGTIVVTADADAAATATRRGATVVLEQEDSGINTAIRAALAHFQESSEAGVLIVPSDIPQLSPAAIGAAVEAIARPLTLAIAAASSDGGTNLLACRPARAVPLHFGPDSFAQHGLAAQRAKLSVCTLRLPDLSLDIDRPDDVYAFQALRTKTGTHAFLSGAALDMRRTGSFALSRSAPAARPHAQADQVLRPAADDAVLTADEAFALVDVVALEPLLRAAARRRDEAHGDRVSYSRKVFIPLTQLCRDVCHYCTFAHPPRSGEPAYLSHDDVREIARAGRKAGCKEALFTLGDKPELRYEAARERLQKLGQPTTLSYLAEAARLVFDETGLLPHVNPGLLTADNLAALRKVSISQGIMLESSATRLMQRGGPHFGSPDKDPAERMATIRAAGEQSIPFTTGILIGIGETRRERIDALLALRALHFSHGHIQEIIIQNFRPKPGTRMATFPAPSLDEHLWTIAAARLIFPASMNIQAPPNLNPGALNRLIEAGINDWGGVSPVTPDHVNPEAPWPHLRVLERATRAAGKRLVERLALYPAYCRAADRWVDPALRPALLRRIDADGWPRTDEWSPGTDVALPANVQQLGGPAVASSRVGAVIDRAFAGRDLSEQDIVALFRARGEDFVAVCASADALRREINGDVVSYVVTRNINYTNICSYRCQFCAFSKGKMSENLRGRPYNLSLDEVAGRARQAWDRGATEVCMQGGIHPDFSGQTYLDLCGAVRAAVPGMHIHAFSPLEVHQGAATLGLPVAEFLRRLKDAGLGTLPGTAAEVLDDEVRKVLCPDKIRTERWLEVVRAAHNVGFKTTATIMYGHVDGYIHWARHLQRLRTLQGETGGFTEFVPLPFVHMEAPVYLKGRARPGPTFREAVLMHAVARLVFHRLIPNIQTSWVKMGPEGVKVCLQAGANDLGGTLMDETITRSAGAVHGQEMDPAAMEGIIGSVGRRARQRNTLYDAVPEERYRASFCRLNAPALAQSGPFSRA